MYCCFAAGAREDQPTRELTGPIACHGETAVIIYRLSQRGLHDGRNHLPGRRYAIAGAGIFAVAADA